MLPVYKTENDNSPQNPNAKYFQDTSDLAF